VALEFALVIPGSYFFGFEGADGLEFVLYVQERILPLHAKSDCRDDRDHQKSEHGDRTQGTQRTALPGAMLDASHLDASGSSILMACPCDDDTRQHTRNTDSEAA
jgi:hypothetical protein